MVTTPVGLDGELYSNILVRPVMCGSMRWPVQLKIGIGVDIDGRSSDQTNQVAVHDETGVRDQHLIAGPYTGQQGQHQCAGNPAT